MICMCEQVLVGDTEINYTYKIKEIQSVIFLNSKVRDVYFHCQQKMSTCVRVLISTTEQNFKIVKNLELIQMLLKARCCI